MAAPKPVRAMRFDRLKVFTGSANPALARANDELALPVNTFSLSNLIARTGFGAAIPLQEYDVLGNSTRDFGTAGVR